MQTCEHVAPDARYEGTPLVTVTLQQCQHCGQFGQTADDILHLGCAEPGKFWPHYAAVVKPVRVQVQVIADV